MLGLAKKKAWKKSLEIMESGQNHEHKGLIKLRILDEAVRSFVSLFADRVPRAYGTKVLSCFF